MLPYIAEFLGTMILIILGDGVVANVNLNKSGMKGGGTVQITIAWGLAVMLPACIFGAASGASFNPALTLALASMEALHGLWFLDILWHNSQVRSWVQQLYIFCSKDSLTQQKIRQQKLGGILYRTIHSESWPEYFQ